MNICDIMTGNVISVGEDEPVLAAARLLKRNNIGSVPVHDGRGKLRGMLTDRDIVLRCVASEADPKTVRVGEIMSRSLVTVNPFDKADAAAERMATNQIRRLPVTDNGILVGIVSLGDLARNDDFEMEAAEALSEISSNFRKS